MPPDRDENLARHPVFALDRANGAQRIRMGAAATVDAGRVDVGRDVGGETGKARTGRGTGLVLVELNDPHVGLEPLRHARDRRLAHTFGPRPRDQNLEIGVERHVLRRGRGRIEDGRRSEGER